MNTELLTELTNHLPPKLLAKVLEEVARLENRCDALQEEVNALENPPHQLCGHAPGRCKC